MTVVNPEARKAGQRARAVATALGKGLSVIFRSRVAVIGLVSSSSGSGGHLAPVIAPTARLPKTRQPQPAAVGPVPLGTDNLGRDILSRLVHGSRTILILAPCSRCSPPCSSAPSWAWWAAISEG
jgi:ABC-type dipeptide/oligopeptide/nickel transport system permease subunit